MKKLALALVCMFSVAFFASCTKTVDNPEPSIAVLTGDDCVYGTVDNPQIISMDDETNWKFGFHIEANAETKKELASLSVNYDYVYNGEAADTTIVIDLTGKTSYDFIDYVFVQDDRATITLLKAKITATVTDADNKTNTAAIAYEIEMEEEELSVEPIEWKREGTNVVDEADMADYGLKWYDNHKEAFATIKPLNDDVILYLCDGAEFDEIEYDSDKDVFFSNLAETATPIEEYRNVSAWQSGDYTDMLAVVYGGEKYLINITHADVERITNSAGQTVRTDVTIKGEAK